MRSRTFGVAALAVASISLVTNPMLADAARSITGQQIQNGSVTTKDIKNQSLLAKDFKPGQLEAGPAGPEGPAGPQGPAGPVGIPHEESRDSGDPASFTEVPSTGMASGRVTPADDQDSFVIRPAGTAPQRITMQSPMSACQGGDTFLEVVEQATDTVVATNDDTEGTVCSSVTFTPNPGGVYTVRATSFRGSAELDYVLLFDRGF